MAEWVIDASVAAKWLAPEAESAQAAALLGDTLHVPDLLFAEVGNILWKKQARGEMDVAASAAAARWLQLAPLHVHAGAGLLDDALAWAVRLQHPVYDCLYLALAVRLGCALVTADRRLAERCRRADVGELAGRVAWLADLPAPPPTSVPAAA